MALVLVVNAGSTTLKLSVVDDNDASQAISSFDERPPGLVAVGHRVVHGGHIRDPVVIDQRVRKEIEEASALAPLHNEPALRAMEEARRAVPDVPHVAVFDTSFHTTLPEEAAVSRVPWEWTRAWGVRRYGFHGLSVSWSAEQAPALLGRVTDGLRLVVCHLGGGCSVTAVRDGRSVDTTMGFSPLEGVAMATRSGSIDPGAFVYLLRERGLTASELDHVLNEESGLKGLSGISGSVRELELVASGYRRARLALDVYAHRIAGAVAAMAASAGGVDALVFTAGVGEGSASVRASVCTRLRFLGVELDPVANARAEHDVDVSRPGSPVRVLVIRAHEEVVAARAVRGLLSDSARAESAPCTDTDAS